MRRVIIGIGNPGRADDVIGVTIAERLKEHFGKTLTMHCLLPEDLPGLRGFDQLIVVDGAVGLPVGEVNRFSIDDLPGSQSSTHFVEMGDLLRLGQELYPDFPKEVLVFGIGIRDLEFRDGLSPQMRSKLDAICQEILESV